MNIALIAHDAKKELMTQFCIAYCGVLSRHTLCATGNDGQIVSEATGFHPAVSKRFTGGDQQIAARIACNEIDLLLFSAIPLARSHMSPTKPICFACAMCIIFRLQPILQLRRH